MVTLVSCSRGDRHVDRIAKALGFSRLLDPTRSRVKGSLMDRGEEHGGISVEDRLGPISMVNVPVEDEDLSCSLLLDVTNHYRHVVQVTEPSTSPGTCMVPWRSDEGERVGKFSPPY